MGQVWPLPGFVSEVLLGHSPIACVCRSWRFKHLKQTELSSCHGDQIVPKSENIYSVVLPLKRL